ncbi:MAG TPA: MotA/TolQ/ExbB proton channel family protein [Phycisphaerales bacterium]|nr:MotA/TolQ/ExbB proton channel family protein [Phycisphaerales bacterium]HMP38144.1 MotA/TolQ/ExbB proton channel family protein [Phycisphaerales bacterium]
MNPWHIRLAFPRCGSHEPGAARRSLRRTAALRSPLAAGFGAALTILLALLPSAAFAQGSAASRERFDGASSEIDRRLQDAVAELAALREAMAADIVPRSRELAQLEQALADARAAYQSRARQFDSDTLAAGNLVRENAMRRNELAYLRTLLSEFARNLESRMHIAELRRYESVIEGMRLAAELGRTDDGAGFDVQLGFIDQAFERIEEALGGTRFEGTVVAPDGLVREGSFALLGPAAIFRSEDGSLVGTAGQRLGSLEPALTPFADPADAEAAAGLIATGSGLFPLDPTLGNAHKIESTRETLWEHMQKGGPVMYPIYVLAGASLLVALWKFLRLLFVRAPSKRALRELLASIAADDREAAARWARRVGGPTGRMLMAGVAHLGQRHELIEEVMYEVVMRTRLRLQRMLPFIAICAAAAPLLGLLGTVTGIITTFKLITIFGSGDVKTLSGGISQALITTEFGLIAAIPALLLHALLSRWAKGITDRMEIVAMQVVNQISRAEAERADRGPAGATAPDRGAPSASPRPAAEVEPRPSAASAASDRPPTPSPSDGGAARGSAASTAVAEPPPSNLHAGAGRAEAGKTETEPLGAASGKG